MAKSFSINGNVATYEQHLEGDVLPKGFEATITVSMDFTGVSMESMIRCCAGTSARVTLAGQLRKVKTEILRKYELDGYKCHFNSVTSGKGIQLTYPQTIAMLSREDGIKQLMSDVKCSEDQAGKYYDNITKG